MSSVRISSTADVVVIGGGLIGTSIGWRLRQAGMDVAVVIGERSAAVVVARRGKNASARFSSVRRARDFRRSQLIVAQQHPLMVTIPRCVEYLGARRPCRREINPRLLCGYGISSGGVTQPWSLD